MGHGRELKAIRQDQSQFQVEISLNTIPAHRGAYVLAVINDVTQRKIMQSEMQAQREELERSNRDLEQFAYVASHDLQEPLRMVARYTELLRERYQGKLDEKADTYIRFAVEGAKRMQQLVADTLAYSRVGSHGEPMAPVSIANVLRRVVVSLREPIRAAAARIEYGAMPTVIGDEIQINQLFQNLVGNAVKFRGAEPPVVTITAVPAGAEWLFAVADNGVGFEAEYSDEIFLMFQRLHARDRYEGTGIGLAIAKRIVERHGGRIWAESRPGQGSTFHFTLQASPDARCR
jgi:light-regulated signal transduction histidine kinase (bacteriophytochrome)